MIRTALALFAFGLLIVLANTFTGFDTIPMVFGLVVTACGAAVLLTTLFDGREPETD